MKIFKTIAVLIAVMIAYSCQESTTDPYVKTNVIDLLTKNIWVYNKSDNGKLPEKIKMKFYKDGTCGFYQDSTWTKGSWTIDSGYTKIALMKDTETDTVTLSTVNDSKLVIKADINSSLTTVTYIPEVNNSAPLQITGTVTFMPDVTNTDLSKAKVCLIWMNPLDEFEVIVWGIGTVNAAERTFAINVDNSVPMSMFMAPSTKINGYFNLAYIALIWDNTITNGKYIKAEDLQAMQIGMVEEKAVIFLMGDYKSWQDIDFLKSDFGQGYNYCKGWYTNQPATNDGWEVTPVLTGQYLKVVKAGDAKEGFKFPNWS